MGFFNIILVFRLPVLAGAAGALGAAYCSPYLAVDGAYHPRPSGQTSSSGATRLVALVFKSYNIVMKFKFSLFAGYLCLHGL